MSTIARPSAIPPSVLAREARLSAALAQMEGAAPSLEPAPLRAFREALASADPAAAMVQVEGLEAAGLLEEAQALLREARRTLPLGPPLDALVKGLAPLAEKAQARRTAVWQLDARRVSVRFAYTKLASALNFDTGDLHRIFLAALRL